MDMWFQFCRALIGSSIIPSCYNFSVGSKKCVRTESAFLKTSINYRNFHMLSSNVANIVLVVVEVAGGPQPQHTWPQTRGSHTTARLGWDFLNYF